MFKHSVTRYYAGVVIAGEQIELRMTPDDDGKIGINVIVLPIITGFDQACSLLSSDRTQAFRPGEIEIIDNSIICQAANEYLPSLKEGFICPLEPGMAPLLRHWLPRLEAIAEIAGKICDLAHSQLIVMDTPVHIRHTYGAFPCVVTGIMLDGLSSADAIKALHHDPLYGSQPALFTVLASEPIHALLVAAQQARASAPWTCHDHQRSTSTTSGCAGTPSDRPDGAAGRFHKQPW